MKNRRYGTLTKQALQMTQDLKNPNNHIDSDAVLDLFDVVCKRIYLKSDLYGKMLKIILGQNSVKVAEELKLSEIERSVLLLEKICQKLSTIGVDIGSETIGDHKIFIFSKVAGGQIRIIDNVVFKNIHELEQAVDTLKEAYGTNDVLWDVPVHLRDHF